MTKKMDPRKRRGSIRSGEGIPSHPCLPFMNASLNSFHSLMVHSGQLGRAMVVGTDLVMVASENPAWATA